MHDVTRKYRPAAGITLIEVVVVVVMVSIVLVLTLPSQGAARRTAWRMQNSTQLRGMHQGMFTFGNSNKEKFPGLNSRGNILANTDDNTGDSGDGDYVQARYWILLEDHYMTPEYAISPSETAAVTAYDPGFDPQDAPVRWDEDIRHYSYALLSIDGEPEEAPVSGARSAEWRQTFNTQAIVASDRNSGFDAGDGVLSIHSGDRGEWRGSVLWNDNHVAFEPSHAYFETRYGNGELNVDPNGWGIDNLFSEEFPGDDDDARGPEHAADALMLAYDDDGIHGGE